MAILRKQSWETEYTNGQLSDTMYDNRLWSTTSAGTSLRCQTTESAAIGPERSRLVQWLPAFLLFAPPSNSGQPEKTKYSPCSLMKVMWNSHFTHKHNTLGEWSGDFKRNVVPFIVIYSLVIFILLQNLNSRINAKVYTLCTLLVEKKNLLDS